MTTATSALPLIAGTWNVDTNHSDVSFTVRHLGISKVRGQFNSFDTTLVVGDSLETSSLSATVDLSSVDTNNADRDGHLQSTDFFNTETHPQMTFSSTSIVENGDNEYSVLGTLTINGTAKPVELAVEFNGTEDLPNGPEPPLWVFGLRHDFAQRLRRRLQRAARRGQGDDRRQGRDRARSAVRAALR